MWCANDFGEFLGSVALVVCSIEDVGRPIALGPSWPGSASSSGPPAIRHCQFLAAFKLMASCFSFFFFFHYPAIKNATLPADSPGSDSFSNILLFSLLVLIPWYFARQVGGGFYTSIFFGIFTTIPILMAFWSIASSISPRKTEKAKYAGRPVEHYLQFHSEQDRTAYRGKSKIPMEVFYEKYFNGEVDFKGDALECLEFRHDWANFRFTMGLYKHFLFGFIPELLVHSRSQGKLYLAS